MLDRQPWLFGLLLLGQIQLMPSCMIQGQDSGICVKLGRGSQLDGALSFCASHFLDDAAYSICVPKENLDFGVTMTEAARTKDKWVKDTVESIYAQRLSFEKNTSLSNKDMNEFGIKNGPIVQRFSNRRTEQQEKDCFNSYHAFNCHANFPRCNAEGNSLMLCRSVCENYMKACGYDYDMQRCYAERFHNSRTPEGDDIDIDKDGYPDYLRAFFPGHPFRDNKINEDETESLVCTPAHGDGAALQPHRIIIALTLALSFLCVSSSL